MHEQLYINDNLVLYFIEFYELPENKNVIVKKKIVC